MNLNKFYYGMDRKKHQHRLNKAMKIFNDQFVEEFGGRFVIRQYSAQWIEFGDRSGAYLVVVMRIYDKKDKVFKSFKVDSFSCFIVSNIFEAINNWIVVDRNSRSLQENDYSNIPFDAREYAPQTMHDEFNISGKYRKV